ncbi:hypothetical protein [Oceanispirochaeta sp.]|jgi:fumarate hydratase class II|uniref:hypothetical protein n=1 Tax=Oceanispirochaeta sp. TaxID=2035350 RepID=UPI002609FC2C|nr:hypothetical protein [Oceanispirochaeta sp.]MDA3958382.1 hypothetical protein [Oceanispirochaeta sp.]
MTNIEMFSRQMEVCKEMELLKVKIAEANSERLRLEYELKKMSFEETQEVMDEYYENDLDID